MDTIRNLVFDLGDVLIHYRWRDFLQDLGAAPQDVERIGAQMFDDPKKLWHEFDLGNVNGQQVAKELAGEYPEDAAVMAEFIRHGEYMHVPRPDVWHLIHLLKKQGYRIYLLSNYPEELFRKHTEYADFMQDLDGRVVSYEIHEGKPEPPIYRALLTKYRLKPEECLFFDDRPENVNGARACGMHAQVVHSKETLLRDLEKIRQGNIEELLESESHG